MAAPLAGGNYHTCGVTAAGGVKCWSRNDEGQLGDATAWRLTPVTTLGFLCGNGATDAAEEQCDLAAPQFVFLDRPQTILTPEQVAALLTAFSAHGITYVTTGERNGWVDRYDAELELNEDGSWRWTPTRNEQTRA